MTFLGLMFSASEVHVMHILCKNTDFTDNDSDIPEEINNMTSANKIREIF